MGQGSEGILYRNVHIAVHGTVQEIGKCYNVPSGTGPVGIIMLWQPISN